MTIDTTGCAIRAAKQWRCSRRKSRHSMARPTDAGHGRGAVNYAAVVARRALAARPGGVVNVSFLTLRRLAQQIDGGRLAATGRRPVASPVIAAALRAVLHQEPGFCSRRRSPSTEEGARQPCRELRAIPDVALDAFSKVLIPRFGRCEDMPISPCAAAGNWYDEEDLLSAVVDGLAGTGDGGAIRAGQWFICCPTRRANPSWCGHFIARWPSPGEHWADRRFLMPTLCQSLATAGGDQVPDPETMRVPVRNPHRGASDPDDEVERSASSWSGWARRAARSSRNRLRQSDPYARLLHEHLAAGRDPRSTAHASTGRSAKCCSAAP